VIVTLKDAAEHSAPFVDSGRCSTDPSVYARVNEAVRRLLLRMDSSKTARKVRFSLDGQNVVTLPREFKTARLCAVDKIPRRLYHTSFEYIENGPGPQPNALWGQGTDLIDEGDGYCTFYPIPADFYRSGGVFLFAATTSAEDAGKTITAYGRGLRGEDVLTSGSLGASVPIVRWSEGVEGNLTAFPSPPDDAHGRDEITSTARFTDLTGLKLPEGRSEYVTLYAVTVEDSNFGTSPHMYFLGKYHPDEVRPDYRRYRYFGDASEGHCVECICKLRYLPASRPDDVVLVQNLDAIKLMVMAIREENEGRLETAVAYEQKAYAELDFELSDEKKGNEPVVRVSDPLSILNIGNLQ